MDDLSLILWRERELLETLLYKLQVERMVLASGDSRWLPMAAREVESMLGSIRETELLRAVAADEAAASIGLAANPSLRALAEAVGEPWQTILLEHREAFARITREITEVAVVNRELLAAGEQHTREALIHGLGGGEHADTYAHDGTAVVVDDRRHRLLDRSI